MQATIHYAGHFPAVPQGIYRPTALDDTKAAADFLVVDVGAKNTIRWKNGVTQKVTDRSLQKLQAAHSWATDF